MRILIADDNPVFQSVLRVMLTNWDYSVVVACDGKEAWQILRAEGAPRLAILDWMMPGLDGIEVCRLARAEFGRSVYILILTAKTQSEDLVEAMQAGADDYVTKPLKSQELRIRLAAARWIWRTAWRWLRARPLRRQGWATSSAAVFPAAFSHDRAAAWAVPYAP